MNSVQLESIFTKAYIIFCASNLRSDFLQAKATKISRNRSKVTATRLKQDAEIDRIERRVDRTRKRGLCVWARITDFQGKYVNWRNLTDDGKGIYQLTLSITDKYESLIPKINKLAF